MEKTSRRSIIASLIYAAGLSAAVIPHSGFAQAIYPNKPIKIVVPFAPGGGADVLARELAKRMSDNLAVPVMVENLAGASTVIGSGRVASSAPDGYTLLMTSTTTFSTNPHLMKSMPFKLEDFAGISLLARSPLALAAAKNTPFNTIKELIDYTKNPANKELVYGTQGQGSIAHFVGAMMASELGIKMVDVPYKGSAPGVNDLLGGQIPLLVDGTVVSLPLVNSGRIKLLGVTSQKRLSAAPNVPTFAESGYPSMVADFKFGLFAPAKTDAAIIRRLNDAVKSAFADKELIDRFGANGTILAASRPEDTLGIFRSDYEMYDRLIKKTGLKFSAD